MKKKLFVFLLSIISVICLAVGLSACENSNSNDDSGDTNQNQTNEEKEGNSGSSDSEIVHTHSLIHFDASSATCTAEGNIEYWICSDCNKYFSDENGLTEITQSDTVIAKVSHTKGEVVIENEVVATCGTDGYYYNVVYCSFCGEKLSNEKVTIPATSNHTMTHYAAVDSTCTQEGNIEYWQCTICNNYYSDENGITKITIDDTITEKTAHTPLTAIIENEVSATCVKDGSYDSVIYCSLCGGELNRETTVISATSVHTYDDNNICTVCGTKKTSEGLSFTLSSSKKYYTLNGIGECIDTDIVIPSTHNSLPVTEIATSAFSNNTAITSVDIPDSVTSIGSYTFEYCVRLANVSLGNSIKTINRSAFYNCSLLTSINIPDSVTTIGLSAFGNCGSLNAVYITDIAAWCNISFSGDIANPLYYAGNLYLNNELVTELTIPDGITQINRNAFYNCTSITSVTLPEEVLSIGTEAFYGCSSLESISIPYGLTTISYYAFQNCIALKKITIPDSVTSIGYYAFYGCSSLESAALSNNLTYIDNRLFGECSSLKEVELGNMVISIGSYVFYSCSSLESISIPNSVTSIGQSAFCLCSSLKEITIPSGVTEILSWTFYSCSSLTKVTIPDNVTSIGSYAFWLCTSLTSITVPNSVTSIGDTAFNHCTSLENVYYNGTAEEWNTISINEYNTSLTSATIYYYSETKPTDSGNYWHYNENDEITVW